MIKPLFCKGKDAEQALAQSAASGARTLHLPDPSAFAPGDRICIGEADGTDVAFCGFVTASETDAITVSRPLADARDATATLWRPSSVFAWSVSTAGAAERRLSLGVAVERAVGGALWSVRTAAPWREDVVRFGEVLRTEFEALRAWLEAQAGGGVEDFAWIDASGAVARVRLASCDFLERETAPRIVQPALTLAVLEEGGYA